MNFNEDDRNSSDKCAQVEILKSSNSQKIKIENQRKNINMLQKKYDEAMDKLKKKDVEIRELVKVSKDQEMKVFSEDQSVSNTNLEKKTKEYEKKLKARDSEIISLNKIIDSFNEDIKLKARTIHTLNEEMKTKLTEIESLQAQQTESSSRDKRLIKNLQSEIQEIKKAADSQKRSLANAKTEVRGTKNSNEKLRQQIKQLKEDQGKTGAVEDGLKKELKQLEQSYLLLKTSHSEVMKLCSSRQEKLDEANETIKSLQDSRLEDQNEIENLKCQLEQVEIEKTNEATKQSEAKTRRILSFKNHELDELNTQFEKQTAELDALRGKFQELKMENETLAGFYESERKLRMKKE